MMGITIIRKESAMGYAVFVGDVALDEYYRADYWPTIQDKAIVRT